MSQRLWLESDLDACAAGRGGRERGSIDSSAVTKKGKPLLRPLLILLLLGISCTALAAPTAACHDDVAALDIEFQAAVARNDSATIERLLPSDYILVSGAGEVQTKADLVNEARAKTYLYTRQDDSHRTVRIWGDTAVLTALLWAQGTTGGRHFNVKVWFSDTYACTAHGWRYVFGQVGTHVPADHPTS